MIKRILPLLVASMLVFTSAASAGKNSDAVLQSALSTTRDWDGYAKLSNHAEIEFKDADGTPVAVAVLHKGNHNAIVTTSTAEDDVTSFILYAVTAAVWQPEDGQHVFQALQPQAGELGFVLCYKPSEQYCFVLRNGAYWLVSAQIGESSFQWNEDRVCYQVLGQGDLEGAFWTPPTGQITLTSFNIRLFPHTVDDVVRLNRLYSQICASIQTQANLIDRKATNLLPVYSAPASGAWRAANGKASASLKQTVNLLGVVENAEGVWTCIEYGINNHASRIGYVKGSLKTGCGALAVRSMSMVTSKTTYLTDDPNVSQAAQKIISAGTPLTVLAIYNTYYAYAESEIDGRLFRGFVPLSALQTSAQTVRTDVMAQLSGQWLLYAGGNMGIDGCILKPDGTLLQYQNAVAFVDGYINDHCELREGSSGNPLGYYLTYDITGDPSLGALNPIGTWSVVDYDPAEKRFWADVSLELLLMRGAKETHLGLKMFDDNNISLMYWEGNCGYVRLLPMQQAK